MLQLVRAETLAGLRRVPTCLVAGTNGKGSLCALLEHTFRSCGLKTALYTSPHLVSPTERIRFNGIPVSEQRLLLTAKRVFEFAKERLPDATFFELMTAIAFELVSAEKVDVFVCEVGLGGRLDSTNVLSPQISVLTSVGLDHMEWLGESEEKIGFEKSLISRRNRPFVVGPCSNEAKSGILSALKITGADATFIADDEMQRSHSDWLLNIGSETVKRWNEGGLPRVEPDALLKASRNYFWPGRFDLRHVQGRPVLLDAAHNSHAVEYFLKHCRNADWKEKLPRPWILLYATLSDKDWKVCLEKLHPVFDEIHLTQTRSPRAVHPSELLNYTLTFSPSIHVLSQENSLEAIDGALSRVKDSRGSMFVLGSLTLLGEVMEDLSIPVFPFPDSQSP
jgi:dihydrofolate synthase/folylpolyglutamate synthase